MDEPSSAGATAGNRTPESDSADEPLPPLEDDGHNEELVARVSLARRQGDRAEDGVKTLLRRAAHRNQAALDRLAR